MPVVSPHKELPAAITLVTEPSHVVRGLFVAHVRMPGREPIDGFRNVSSHCRMPIVKREHVEERPLHERHLALAVSRPEIGRARTKHGEKPCNGGAILRTLFGRE